MAAVDLARHLGARVIAGVGSPAKMQAIRAFGAHEVVDYRGEDLKAAIRRLTDGRGVDVFFDNVGGEVFDTMSRLMNWGGRILPVGFTSGSVPALAMNLPLLKNYSVVGCYWGAWIERAPEASRAAEERLLAWVGAGELRPLVDERISLERVPQAMARVADRQTIGRIVVDVRPG
jgi:NADPH2:quinone reductase